MVFILKFLLGVLQSRYTKSNVKLSDEDDSYWEEKEPKAGNGLKRSQKREKQGSGVA